MTIVPEDNGVAIEVTAEVAYFDLLAEVSRLRDLVDGKVVEECPECGGVGDVRRLDGDMMMCPVCSGSGAVKWVLAPTPYWSEFPESEPLDLSDIPF